MSECRLTLSWVGDMTTDLGPDLKLDFLLTSKPTGMGYEAETFAH